ncbi:hypothetical protein CW354_03195 [Marinicaulis flavus]|uniref:Uncharacterized protein n=2 Tax=Hyphococcus luteus TaxID=2058213 RepID=A0A2S7K940_9PROT|nr:hypothetical protein CW354_03195 [Marinicaulis flavus]
MRPPVVLTAVRLEAIMRIVTNDKQQLFIITSDNNVCRFVGARPSQTNPLRAPAPAPERATIAQSFLAACSGVAESLHRAAARRQ